MFSRLLIANRGEIACRIIATARRMGVATLAVYSEADRQARHVRLADAAVCIGPAPAARSYLNGHALIATAVSHAAEAVHPGYGFLSENPEFAEACLAAGLCFIGPPPSAIRAMGAKHEAKARMVAAGVPVIPGSHEPGMSDARLTEAAHAIGFPVLLKACAGGGGKGMRVVAAAAELAEALAAARREARAAFGDDELLIEKYLAEPRHVEVQVFADSHGQCIHLFERDCSIQRRHQKVLEEAPAPGLSPVLRSRLGEAAVAAARSIGYVGAGTVEFLLAGDEFFFMEMNTRLQVEHPVTELVTGQDLVAWQLRVAAGEPLPVSQAALQVQGHAIEARLYAEDPARDYLPSTGRLWRLRWPTGAGVRVDAGVDEGDEVTAHYDPLLAKVISHGRDRPEALARLQQALGALQVAGVTTNLPLLAAVANSAGFRAGAVSTGYLPAHPELGRRPPPSPQAVLLAALVLLGESAEASDPPWQTGDSWRLNLAARRLLHFRLGDLEQRLEATRAGDVWQLQRPGDGTSPPVQARLLGEAASAVVAELDGQVHRATVAESGGERVLWHRGETWALSLDLAAPRGGSAPGSLASPLPGQVIAIAVEVGQQVGAGDLLLVVEAMKMEHPVRAPHAGKVLRLMATVGARVTEGQVLVQVETPDS